MAEARRKAEASLAQLQIMHRDELTSVGDPETRARLEENYLTDRRRVEVALESELAKLRHPE